MREIHDVVLPYTTSFAASDPSHPCSAVTHGGRPAWRWSIDAVAYTQRKPATAGCCCVCFCLLFGCWLLLKLWFSLFCFLLLSSSRWAPTPSLCCCCCCSLLQLRNHRSFDRQTSISRTHFHSSSQ